MSVAPVSGASAPWPSPYGLVARRPAASPADSAAGFDSALSGLDPALSGLEPTASGSSSLDPASSGLNAAASGLDPASSGLDPASSGLDPADLERQLRGGASVAEVAAARGVSPGKIIEAIMSLMVPNPDSNGDMTERIALHRTAPVRHRPHPPAPDPALHRHTAAADAVPGQLGRAPRLPGAGPARAAGVTPAAAAEDAAPAAAPRATPRVPPPDDSSGGTGGSVNLYA